MEETSLVKVVVVTHNNCLVSFEGPNLWVNLGELGELYVNESLFRHSPTKIAGFASGQWTRFFVQTGASEIAP